jgi:hypothetical protein
MKPDRRSSNDTFKVDRGLGFMETDQSEISYALRR